MTISVYLPGPAAAQPAIINAAGKMSNRSAGQRSCSREKIIEKRGGVDDQVR
jgi:hypothetical protein